MSKFELKLPKMGESVAEATITGWLKEVGETIELDEAIVEIATDKVDSEVPSEVDGVLLEKRFEVDDVIKVGQVVAACDQFIRLADLDAVLAQALHGLINRLCATRDHRLVRGVYGCNGHVRFASSDRLGDPLLVRKHGDHLAMLRQRLH